MLSYVYWSPDSVAFHLPFFNHPIMWYGILFALGFLVGFHLFKMFFRYFLCYYPEFTEADIIDWNKVLKGKKDTERERKTILKKLNERLEEKMDQHQNFSPFFRFVDQLLSIQQLRRFKNRLYIEKELGSAVQTLKLRSKLFSEKFAIYIMFGAIVGARLGHILFYENWPDYFFHPFMIFKVWEGGLASHGAVIGMFIGIALFYFKIRKQYSMISILRIIDLLVIPSLYAGTFIRIGNFINQEILGKTTSLPWGIIFGNPAGELSFMPRHPAQLYEAFFYFLSFLVFFRFFSKWLFPVGRISGFFFISTFSFRFLIEFIKEEQSFYLSNHFLNMGHYLSLPYIVLGIAFLIFGKKIEKKKVATII